MPDNIATARMMADKLRPLVLDPRKGEPADEVSLSRSTATTILLHLETLARLEENGEDLLVEALEKATDDGYDGFVYANHSQDPDGMEGRGMYLEGTFAIRPVLRHILGAAK